MLAFLQFNNLKFINYTIYLLPEGLLIDLISFVDLLIRISVGLPNILTNSFYGLIS